LQPFLIITAEQFAEADLLAVMLFANEWWVNRQKDRPAGASN
jgi:hypothetical protein